MPWGRVFIVKVSSVVMPVPFAPFAMLGVIKNNITVSYLYSPTTSTVLGFFCKLEIVIILGTTVQSDMEPCHTGTFGRQPH
jgi:hypothetical protein